MNKADALRVFVAAQDDPVLAAWAAVVHEHKASPYTDVSPYEYWEAFQELFSYGLVSPEQYNGINARRVFFERSPPAGEIQRVLDNLRVLAEYSNSSTEQPSMSSKTKLPSNPFGDPHETNGNAMVTNERGASLVGHRPNGLGAPRSSAPLSPFGGKQEMRGGRESIPLEPFGNKPTLPCRDDVKRGGNRLAKSEAQMHGVNIQIYCCGTELEMEVADMQAEGPDAPPGGQISVLSCILHGTCSQCEREHHHSIGQVVRADDYR